MAEQHDKTPEKATNRLGQEKSPYLLQHAANPVDWYAWNDAAFAKARTEDKPIFLSIGYSTCHWCHVMAHESFEDPEVARLMNAAFVCIKVDREERPDIDGVYMTVCQMLTGSGGWPLTIIMTPAKQPFFAATYIPKHSRGGRYGMLDLIPKIEQAWRERRPELLKSGSEIITLLNRSEQRAAGPALDARVLTAAYEGLRSSYDSTNAGFGRAPKFPTPHNLLFLLRYWKRSGAKDALDMVTGTLAAMRRGGIYDQIGYGFHRYATDPVWLVPHFEKMLYDQALLVMAYIETYQATGDEQFAATAREIISYVQRDMTAPAGGFYSAEDADSEGEEGKFYVWKTAELEKLLKPEALPMAAQLFGITPDGNFYDEASGRKTGANILHLDATLEQFAASHNLLPATLKKQVEHIRQTLFAARDQRVHPHKDDKVLTDWNGLMIAALAKAGRVLQDARYCAAAALAADFVLQTLRTPDGRLLHRYRDGEAAIAAHVDDYSFMIWGLLELYEATFDVKRLEQALALQSVMDEQFRDEKAGAYFSTADDAEQLLVRRKEIYDGAVPSGNSVAALNLLRLGRITARPELEQQALQISALFSEQVRQSPWAFCMLLLAVDYAAGPSFEVVIAGKTDAEDANELARQLQRAFIPNKVVVFRPTEIVKPPIVAIAPYTKHQTGAVDKALAYVCKDFACRRPTDDPQEMLKQLGE